MKKMKMTLVMTEKNYEKKCWLVGLWCLKKKGRKIQKKANRKMGEMKEGRGNLRDQKREGVGGSLE